MFFEKRVVIGQKELYPVRYFLIGQKEFRGAAEPKLKVSERWGDLLSSVHFPIYSAGLRRGGDVRIGKERDAIVL